MWLLGFACAVMPAMAVRTSGPVPCLQFLMKSFDEFVCSWMYGACMGIKLMCEAEV
jgi:hypothetical protein